MELRQKVVDAVSEIGKSHISLRSYEREVETAGKAWLDKIKTGLAKKSREDIIENIIDLSSVAESLRIVEASPGVNALMGSVLSLLIDLERQVPRSELIMRRLVSGIATDAATKDRRRILIVNSGSTSVKVAVFDGIEKTAEADLHLSPDEDDTIENRVSLVTSWMGKNKIAIESIDGIASRCGFINPVPSGTYHIVPEMIEDLQTPRVAHGSNMSIIIAKKLADMSPRSNEVLLTTSDPVVSDEIETVERLTGFVKIKRDGTGAHYLNHKAVCHIMASTLGKREEDIDALTAHLGNGMSIALHRKGKVAAVVDAISGIPSTSRSGPIDLSRLLNAFKSDDITIKELESIISSRGGLMSLAGTNDFRALDAFRTKGATSKQQKKIELIYDFFARQIVGSALKLWADGDPLSYFAITGGLAHSGELVNRIETLINGRIPLITVPGSFEPESLAAGCLRAWYEPEKVKSYVEERDALNKRRTEEDNLLDTVIFERKLIYKKKDAPIVSLDELIDSTCIEVRENYTPTIAIVGANNEEAILAAKRANEEGSYRIAKFLLLGDFAEINQIAYDYDLIIDNDNYTIIDTENPIEDAITLLEEGKAQILMKGYVKTEQILRGVFQFLKKSGRIKSGELMSHVFVMDIPVRNKLLLISDAAVNTYPDETKRIKITENALKVASNLNIAKPKVAIVSAIESVNRSIESSIEAERIAGNFADRNDCIVEGPLSFDVAMDQNIAAEKRYSGEIKGSADVLIMPDIDAGNVLYKSLTTQSGATAAGVILCGDMPLVLTSRGDSARSKLSSISLGVRMLFDLQKKTV